jgi:hypothetical protein
MQDNCYNRTHYKEWNSELLTFRVYPHSKGIVVHEVSTAAALNVVNASIEREHVPRLASLTVGYWRLEASRTDGHEEAIPLGLSAKWTRQQPYAVSNLIVNAKRSSRKGGGGEEIVQFKSSSSALYSLLQELW